MPAVQRVGDRNVVDGVITASTQSLVSIKGILVSVVGDPVADPVDGPQQTSVGSSLVSIKGVPIVLTGNPDTCGHPRTGGSPLVSSEK